MLPQLFKFKWRLKEIHMDNSTGLIALIPAWGHNENDKHKWLRDYCDKPLIKHTFDLVKNCQEIQKVLLGTNLEALHNFSSTENTFQIFRSNKTESLRSCTEVLEKREGDVFKWILVLNPFYPFRSPENVMECYQRVLIDGLARGIQSVCESSLDKSMMGPSFETALGIWRRDWIFSNMEEDDSSHVIPYEMPAYSFVSLENQENDVNVASLVKNPCHILDF